MGSAMWKQQFPRLFDLYDRSNKNDLDNYFRGFQSKINHGLAREWYEKLEATLGELDKRAWDQLARKVVPYVTARDEEHQRHWQQLFDHLNESEGYLYLRKRGYENIQFLDEVSTIEKIPDIEGEKTDHKALMEVKSINNSDDEIRERNRRPPRARRAGTSISTALENQICCNIQEAHGQLKAFSSAEHAHWYALVLLELDTDVRQSNQLQDQLRDIENEKSSIDFHVIIRVTSPL